MLGKGLHWLVCFAMSCRTALPFPDLIRERHRKGLKEVTAQTGELPARGLQVTREGDWESQAMH